jgi:hypothetical protein
VSRAERITGTARVRPGPALVDRIRPLSLAAERLLPLPAALGELFPVGLRHGSTVVVCARPSVTGDQGSPDRPPFPQGARSLALALAATVTAGGSWCAMVGVPDLGILAAAELGVALERLALVPRVPPDQWVTVVGALVDSMAMVLVRPPARLRQGDARRLTARARERGAVLVVLLTERAGGAWSDGADARLTVKAGRWEGPGGGDGCLQARRVEIEAGGRGAAARPRLVELWLPASGGGVAVIAPDAFAASDADLLPDLPDLGGPASDPAGRERALRSAG